MIKFLTLILFQALLFSPIVNNSKLKLQLRFWYICKASPNPSKGRAYYRTDTIVGTGSK